MILRTLAGAFPASDLGVSWRRWYASESARLSKKCDWLGIGLDIQILK